MHIKPVERREDFENNFYGNLMEIYKVGRIAGYVFRNSGQEEKKHITNTSITASDSSVFWHGLQVPVQYYYSDYPTNFEIKRATFAIGDSIKIKKPKHDRKNLNFEIAPKKGNYEVNNWAQALIRNTFKCPRKFDTLYGLFFHPSLRQVRSEFRRNVIKVLCWIFDLLNLHQMKLGFYEPNYGRFIPFSLKYLAAKAKISKSVMDDVCKLFKKNNIWTIKVKNERDPFTHEWRTTESHIIIHDTIFELLNLTTKFLEDRIKAKNNFHKKEIQYQSARLALERARPQSPQYTEYKKQFKGFMRHILIRNKPSYTHSTYESSLVRKFAGKALELHKNDPTKSCSEYTKELIARELNTS